MTYKAVAISLLALAASATISAAQTTVTPAPTTPSTTAAPVTVGAGEFLAQAQTGQWRASKLVGVDIYGPDNAKVGDVDEIMLDQNGSVVAVVIGVGGFLGIGAKGVAMPMKSVRWEMTPRAATSTNTAPGRDPAPVTTTSNVNQDYPAYGVVQLTKEQLQNAPTFRYLSDAASSATTPTSTPNSRTTPTRP